MFIYTPDHLRTLCPACSDDLKRGDRFLKKERKTIACVNASGAFTSCLNEVGYLVEVGYFQSSAMTPPHIHVRHTRWCQYARKYPSDVHYQLSMHNTDVCRLYFTVPGAISEILLVYGTIENIEEKLEGYFNGK